MQERNSDVLFRAIREICGEPLLLERHDDHLVVAVRDAEQLRLVELFGEGGPIHQEYGVYMILVFQA